MKIDADAIAQVDNIFNNVVDNAQYFNNVLDNIVSGYTHELDELLEKIKTELTDVDNPPADVIEHYFLELSNLLYFISCKSEKLGIYDTISKSVYKEAYNNAYMNNTVKDGNNKNKMTVAELTAIAEQSSLYESTVNDVYSKAYKIVKNKIDAARDVMSTLSKMLSRRMQEQSITDIQPDTGRKILNEEVF